MSSKIIKVLLIDDDEDDFVETKDMLEASAEHQFALSWAPNVKQGVEEIRSGAYDAYLVDYRLGEQSGIDLLREEFDFGRKAPVIVLTGRGTQETDIEAMRSGAASYLVKGELEPGELERSIRYAIERHRKTSPPAVKRQRQARTIAFIGAKGGVGTTTVAANIATELARHGKEVLIVDFRAHYGTCACQLGLPGNAGIGDLLKLEPDAIDVDAVRGCLIRHASGLYLLAASGDVANYGEIGTEHAGAILRAARELASFVMLDLPSQPSPAVHSALEAADFVAVVAERNRSCVTACERTLAVFAEWGLTTPKGVLIVDRAKLTDPFPLSEIRSLLDCEIYGIVPGDPDLCVDHASAPLVMEGGSDEVTAALERLAERLSAAHIKPMPI